jgi:hypothetical protein
MVDCPNCFHEVTPASVPGGGRVAWWCERCSALYPDDDYVTMKHRPLGFPR